MPEVFSPSSFGLRLQRFFPLRPRYQVEHDEREQGFVKSVALSEKPLFEWDLTYRAFTRRAVENLHSFFARHVGTAGRFLFELPEFIPSPDLGPTLTAVAGGAQGSRTVFVKSAWKTAAGITEASTATTLVVPANNLLKVTLPQPYPASVTQSVIYATQGAAGTEVEQTVLTNLKTWTQPDAALLTGTAAPQTTNAVPWILTSRLREDYEVVRGHGTAYEVTLQMAEAS